MNEVEMNDNSELTMRKNREPGQEARERTKVCANRPRRD